MYEWMQRVANLVCVVPERKLGSTYDCLREPDVDWYTEEIFNNEIFKKESKILQSTEFSITGGIQGDVQESSIYQGYRGDSQTHRGFAQVMSVDGKPNDFSWAPD